MELLPQAAMRSGERIDNKGDVFVIILRNSIINEIDLLFYANAAKRCGQNICGWVQTACLNIFGSLGLQ
jgi:hypothetical protein